MQAEFPTCPVTKSLTHIIPEETKEEMLRELSDLKQYSDEKKRQLVEDCFRLGIENINIVERVMGECDDDEVKRDIERIVAYVTKRDGLFAVVDSSHDEPGASLPNHTFDKEILAYEKRNRDKTPLQKGRRKRYVIPLQLHIRRPRGVICM